MLTFRNTNILFVLLLTLLSVLWYNQTISGWWLVVLLISYSLVLFYGSYNVASGFYLKTICQGNTTHKKIALTFDDGPAIEHTSAILAILQQYNVPAAFFCIGHRITGNEQIIKNIHEQGHIIGNHSYSHHFWFDMQGSQAMQNDLERMDTELQKLLPLQPAFFRPPYGVTTPPMAKTVAIKGYHAIGWNIRSMDTVTTDNNKLFEKVTAALQPGSILLFHDTIQVTVEALPRIIEEAKRQGYQFERLDKLVGLNPYMDASKS